MKLKYRSGFSLIEVLLVVVLLGVLSSLSYPIVINIIQKSTEESVICFAKSVDAAKSSFWIRNPKAEQEYAKQTTNDERYDLIREYLANGKISLVRSLPSGFKLIMPKNISNSVEVLNKEGEIVY